MAVEHGKFRMAWIGLIDEANDYVKPIIFAGEEQGYLTSISIAVHEPILGGGPTGTAIREGRCTISQDIASDPSMTPWREQALQRGYRSSASVPIREKGDPIGALTVYASNSLGFSDDDQNLLNEIGQDISYAIDTIDTENERKQAEEVLRETSEHLTYMLANSPTIIYDLKVDGDQAIPIWISGNIESILGYSVEAALQSEWWLGQIYPADRSAALASLERIFDDLYQHEYRFVRKDGQVIWLHDVHRLLRDEDNQPREIVGAWANITERKQAEQTIRQHITELETLYESGLELGQLFSPKVIAHKLIDLMRTKLEWHHTVIRLYHEEDETLELLAFNLPTMINTAEYEAIKERFKTLITKAGDGLSGWAVQHGQAVRVGELAQDSRYVEIQPGLHSGMYVPLKAGERMVGVISIESEISNAFSEADEHLVITLANQAAVALENSRLHEETMHQIKRLEALHAIDQSITGTFDQRSTLDVLLTHTLDQLEADAAVVFLLEPYQQTLQYSIGKGFHTHLIETTNLKLSETFAGRAIIERRMIYVSDQEIWALDARKTNPALAKLWLEEGFKCMDAVSLISKGQVKGLLSVYHRKAFTPNPAWSSFFETLAGQAAIAIESTQLFNGLQKANMELAVAYDATIEGWSRAMDLRDRETEGHTERVSEMSMRLGKAMELGEEYLVQLRRGALLHDIGKLGVPDNILLKVDKLTDEEWQIMKRHPQFAYDMLNSITYLRRALDIPYCHHEKWDGTGYPQGLKGTQIPLAARIFAIVDVWDALTSDRPYRQAWSKQETLKYIREQSGKHFDPQVVDIFLKEFEHE